MCSSDLTVDASRGRTAQVQFRPLCVAYREDDYGGRDDVIDAMFDDTKKEVIELIQNNGAGAEVATDLLMVAKYFERIGDHATNIAEWVIFSINGTHPTINPEPVL